MSTLSSVLNRCIPKPDKHIFVLPYNGWFEKSLCKTGHTFYGEVAAASHPWNPNTFNMPENFVLLSNRVPPGLEFDFVLINDIYKQIDRAYQISCELHIPIVNVNHYHPWFFKREDLQKLKNEYKKIYANIAISEDICLGWQSGGEMIGYEVDMRPTHIKTNAILLLGQYQQKDYFLIKDICEDFPNLVIIGDNPGLSRAGSIEDEDIALDNSKIYIHLSTDAAPLTNIYRAMAAGCVVICNKTPSTEGLIIDGFNGFIAESVDDFRLAIDKVMKNESLANKIGSSARNTIETDYSTPAFIEKWNRVFDFASRSVFKK